MRHIITHRVLACVAAFLSIVPTSASAMQSEVETPTTVVNVTPSMSTPALQNAISNAPLGATILFAAGTYSITGPLYIPCSGLQITGPAAANPTAVLAASFTGSDIFSYPSGCASPGSVEY